MMLLSGLNKEQKNLKYIIDVTIGYVNGRPVDLLNAAVGANEPSQTVIYYRKYLAAMVPRSESQLTNWLYERFAEKDRLLDHFYRTGTFPTECSNGSIMGDSTKHHLGSLRPVTFSPKLCLLMHAFYIISTFLHLYFAIYISCTAWSWFV